MKQLKYIIYIMSFIVLSSCGNDDNIDEPIIEPEIPEIELQEGMNLAGRIQDEGNPIAGVVVSDGYTVTTTNSDGIYQMKRNPEAKFVFISIPEDCEIPVDGSIPAFYQKIDQEKEAVFANFELRKSSKKTNYVLIAIADPQPSDIVEMGRFSSETITDIIETVGSFPENTHLYGISVGDLVWDEMRLFPHYKTSIDKLGFPVFQVIGNHDHDQAITNNDTKASHKYEEYFGPTYYSYNIGDCHYVVLDDVLYRSRDDYDATITQEQLDWLKKDLEHVSKDKLIIVGVHIPTQRRNSSSAVTNKEALYGLLDGYKVRIISGHTHYNFNTSISSNIEENTLGAACGAFWSGDIGGDGGPNGYAIYEIKGNEISNWYYKGTNQKDNYQIKLYPVNSWSSKSTSIIANIWNWHNNWIVSVYEDGASKGTMSRYTDYDPFAYETLYGEDKPARHPVAAEPIKTDHLFSYTPSTPTWSKITVKVADSFGNEYTNEIVNTVP